MILLWIGSALYYYQAVTTLSPPEIVLTTYKLVDVLLLTGIVSLFMVPRGSRAMQWLISWLMSLVLLIFVPRLFSLPPLVVEDIGRLFNGMPARSIWVSELTVGLSGVVFLLVLFGLTRGKHFYRVRREQIYFKDLPEAFDGLQITQISDVHSGSFTDVSGVQKGLDLINEQQSDLILFTGDLVNNKASEMEPWIKAFSGLRAPMGKFSVLGNHDYGDYIPWPSEDAKSSNLKRLKEIHREIGFRLLLDEAVSLRKDGQSISILGVENWGKGGFHKYGDLRKALSAVPDKSFKILLSHDPSHWEAVILAAPQHVHLTLSGHTHGMQFGIELFGFKWSPVKYVYKQWAGLYQRAGRYLYVNRGFGFLGLKGRIGMWPEITVITVKRKA